jgi:NTE family protein
VRELPDILVLGGGGRQGDAWMSGVLAGLEDSHGLSFATCEYFVGTSAGAVLAALLASGFELPRPAREEFEATPGSQSPLPNWLAQSAMAIAAPFASAGMRLGTRPGAAVRALALRAVPMPTADVLDFSARFPAEGIRFDGRLRIVAVDRSSGRRVVFGAPGAPRATVAQALAASCAVPVMFAPAVIGGRQYVDGGVWSSTNADAAPASQDARVLILAPMASRHGPFMAAVRAASRVALLAEASALKARRARVRIITPDQSSAASIGRDPMSTARLVGTQTAGYRQGLAA